jgi:hypothetical protein
MSGGVENKGKDGYEKDDDENKNAGTPVEFHDLIN